MIDYRYGRPGATLSAEQEAQGGSEEAGEDDLAELEEAIGNATFRLWLCPIPGHSSHRDSKGRPVQTVEWDDGIAYCCWHGCGRSSVDTSGCNCDGVGPEGRLCAGECCGIGQCTCTTEGAQG